MSFILDALKKSEAERLRKGAPGIANIPASGRQKIVDKVDMAGARAGYAKPGRAGRPDDGSRTGINFC